MLPAIRAARGRIVFVSSIGGLIAFPMTGAYHAAKFGIEAVGDVFRRELRRWGISVSIVEPGSIATAIWDRGEAAADEIAGALAAARGPLRQGDRALPRGPSEASASAASRPSRAARTIEHALTAAGPAPAT